MRNDTKCAKKSCDMKQPTFPNDRVKWDVLLPSVHCPRCQECFRGIAEKLREELGGWDDTAWHVFFIFFRAGVGTIGSESHEFK